MNALRKRRIELGLTLKEVANILGVSESTISRYEMMEVEELSVNTVRRLANALQCSPSELLGWDASPAKAGDCPFTDDELYILSYGVMRLIMDIDSETEEEKKEKYSELHMKVCKQIERFGVR